MVFAGVTVGLDPRLATDHTTLLRRSRELRLERLSASETQRVFVETAAVGGRRIDDDALDSLFSLAQGYLYLVQLAGDYAWRNNSTAPTITHADVVHAQDRAIRALESRVSSRAYGDLSGVDQQFLNAMAVDDGPSKVADIVERMNVFDACVQVYKKRVVESGYVHPAGRGYVQFSFLPRRLHPSSTRRRSLR